MVLLDRVTKDMHKILVIVAEILFLKVTCCPHWVMFERVAK
jgi:hypothetical protein